MNPLFEMLHAVGVDVTPFCQTLQRDALERIHEPCFVQVLPNAQIASQFSDRESILFFERFFDTDSLDSLHANRIVQQTIRTQRGEWIDETPLLEIFLIQTDANGLHRIVQESSDTWFAAHRASLRVVLYQTVLQTRLKDEECDWIDQYIYDYDDERTRYEVCTIQFATGAQAKQWMQNHPDCIPAQSAIRELFLRYEPTYLARLGDGFDPNRSNATNPDLLSVRMDLLFPEEE